MGAQVKVILLDPFAQFLHKLLDNLFNNSPHFGKYNLGTLKVHLCSPDVKYVSCNINVWKVLIMTSFNNVINIFVRNGSIPGLNFCWLEFPQFEILWRHLVLGSVALQLLINCFSFQYLSLEITVLFLKDSNYQYLENV